ncbi:DUF3159 domain-containing protein [Brachybacterium kimchii]|uniref:DUF3159 domain-containing protein n=1 Tax=Brachybacterium kimchii TaxID=2942909 RepID=A0ABY4N8P3_9MICO|nr:DUF3159 domain-containing protein [Brachybacterium kimchii]UQN30921.1 DUF3159 domain-containing protein [Brachybacterium kimchii]
MSSAQRPEERAAGRAEDATAGRPGRAAPRSDHAAPRSGMGAVLAGEEFSVGDALGGPRGIVESVLPTALFVVLFVITRSIPIAGGAAVAVVLVALVVRLVQRQNPSQVLGGLIGVTVGAIWALRSGQGTDFYVPGLITNAVAAAVLVVSILARYPLVGVVVGLLDPRVAAWRGKPLARRAYTQATWLFVGLYVLKLAVQLPLYLSGQVAALGVAKLVMGLPLFALVVWLVWMLHRSVRARLEAEAESAPDATV